MWNSKRILPAAGTALALLVATGPSSAQEVDVELDEEPDVGAFGFEASGGAALPVADLADFYDPGSRVGAALTYQATPRVALRLEGGVDLLNDPADETVVAPNLRLWHYGAGASVGLLPDATEGRWSLAADAGLGATTIATDDFLLESDPTNPGPTDFSQTYFMANGGLRLGYELGEHGALFLRGGANVTFADAEETAFFGEFVAPGEVDEADDEPGLDTAITIPFTLGVQIGL